ncbi:CRISPR-associated endonuclease Cas2 [Campylobacter canadensis]|uniref:CRISPR-associated endonuclease Cas2 n=1 Tax=Campylobacter canadensis TaxID=449520 RepID=A0ABS7WPJ4_9BACT|nr:CRISPR-associated endonuclease Cas2 [Campylobacter canadensis]MBZ7986684.1 CRISPR-associated endonuclease Cas2 [Campylobacter canadensis]MBZ7994622.1 CRISPR-associated endonuclease Cas2 [Campylobacter canadensis]MBZ7996818.1 CRISPR-associated endonuclease Cas2 [Campylobacter canadensis]MBZ7997720.1 CRISPR-associated endonuclease Cas2 [Campylobacter canadensis]MBZ7999953.1 CRISPR-associated endonuclease Cas2 [Campylobacter canadensis]
MYLVSYDIENTKNRTKLFEELKDLGLLNIQKSVFYGELSKSEIKVVKELFKKLCGDEDKAFLCRCKIDLNDTHGYKKADLEQVEFDFV